MTNSYAKSLTQKPIPAPDEIINSLKATSVALTTVQTARQQASDILTNQSDKLAIILGPCSIHDPAAALDYAKRLHEIAGQYNNELLLIMRMYFEKPRSTIGWRGLISDPHLDGSHDVVHGLITARKLLLDLNELGIPAATEFLDPITPLYLADLISWSVIGARTAESQLHRQIASGLPMPVGFKNNTDGNIQIAIDAMTTAAHPHHYIGLSHTGQPALINTAGNSNTHIILRGGRNTTNYAKRDINETTETLKNAGLTPKIMVDCSHGNSQKNYLNQQHVASEIADQIAAGSSSIFGVMLESHLNAGKQSLRSGQPLQYGQSITDACLAWEETLPILELLAHAVTKGKST